MPLNVDKISGRYIHLGNNGWHCLSQIKKTTKVGKQLQITKTDNTTLIYDDQKEIDRIETILKKEGK